VLRQPAMRGSWLLVDRSGPLTSLTSGWEGDRVNLIVDLIGVCYPMSLMEVLHGSTSTGIGTS